MARNLPKGTVGSMYEGRAHFNMNYKSILLKPKETTDIPAGNCLETKGNSHFFIN